MKTCIIFILFCSSCLQKAFSQDNIESLVEDIRQKYKQINAQKKLYKTEEESYNWERDELIPSLSEEEKENEYNEAGNFIASKITYSNKEDNVNLIEIDDETGLYQESYSRNRYREYYFWDGELFFYFEHSEEFWLSPKEKVSEKRIYLHDEKIIRYLTKEYVEEAFDAIQFINMQDIKNQPHDVDSLTYEDYGIIYEYDYFSPDW